MSIASNGIAAALAQDQATVTYVAPVVTAVDFTTAERQTFNGTVATFSVVPGTTAEPASDYAATIDWGDGSPATPGTITSAGGTFIVTGTHTYGDIASATSTTYPVSVTVHDLVGGTYGQAVGQATVTAVSLGATLTGFLNASTDTGPSKTDAVTSNDQPSFFGTAEPQTSISVYATPQSGGSPILLGKTETDAAGSWSLTSNYPLPEGTYIVDATVVDQGGVNSATRQILPNATQGPLVIDTTGPTVTGFQFDPVTGQFAITFQDNLSGLSAASLMDGANYVVTSTKNRTPLHVGKGFIVSDLSVTMATSSTGTDTVIGTIDGGRYLKGGLYTFTVLSGGASGIQDVAGNGLDGDFYGYFPSGNGTPGGNFVARVNYIHGYGSRPLPESSSASPTVPPGTLGSRFRIRSIRISRNFELIKSTGASGPINQNLDYYLSRGKAVPVGPSTSDVVRARLHPGLSR